MKKHDSDDHFRVRPHPPRSREGGDGERFLVLTRNSHVGETASSRARARRPGARTGRGFVASQMVAGSIGVRSRRVTIKARIVVLKTAGARAVSAHLRYIARDGVARDGQPAEPYSATEDEVDLQAFLRRGSGDRHQFRFIVAPEDAGTLGDLRTFTRHLMSNVARDLGTRVDWVAVDHWDTDNPHTHLVLRGRDAVGGDLVIAGDYVAKGMRTRAAELALEWLGPRTDLEIQQTLRREVVQDRWTSLDRELTARSVNGRVDLSSSVDSEGVQGRLAFLLERLKRLQRLGLSREEETGHWHLRSDAEGVLRTLGERGDITKAMQRALGRKERELTIFDPATATKPIIGRVAGTGLADELGDHGYLVVDGVDGRAHYVSLQTTELADLPRGGIVEVRPAGDRPADRNVLKAVRNGLYQPVLHVAALQARGRSAVDAEDIVTSHVRRLEALRRAGIVQRVSEEAWSVPTDLVERGKDYDRRRSGPATVQLLSVLPLEQQVSAMGATWLDTQLTKGDWTEEAKGFGGAVYHQLRSREDFLIEHGLATRRGTRVSVTMDLLTTLRQRELTTAAEKLSRELGQPYRPAIAGSSTSGVYERSIQLVSGRFAVLDSGASFSLVPWRPVIDKQLGQSLTAKISAHYVVWEVGRGQSRS